MTDVNKLFRTNEISLKERHILESYASELHKIINSMETVVDETENISSLMASTLKLELNSLSPGSQDRCAVSRTCELKFISTLLISTTTINITFK